jgi:hypothetical protein
MAVRVTSLNRPKNGVFVARKSIPADVREAYARLYKKGWDERLTLPADTPTHEVKTRHGEGLAEIETHIACREVSSHVSECCFVCRCFLRISVSGLVE